MSLPSGSKYVVIGAGVHGLSTAYHLAKHLKALGKGSGADILVIDKKGVGAGASGIACGVVRNNYYQPAMRELKAHSVSVWERHADVLSYHGVGYMQISPECMHELYPELYVIREQQKQAILDYLSEQHGSSLEAMSDAIGLSKNSMLRRLESLIQDGSVEEVQENGMPVFRVTLAPA